MGNPCLSLAFSATATGVVDQLTIIICITIDSVSILHRIIQPGGHYGRSCNLLHRFTYYP